MGQESLNVLVLQATVLCKAVLSRVTGKRFYSSELFIHVLCALR